MPRGPESALKKLARVRKERVSVEAREMEIRREAAVELGEDILDAGAESIEPAKLVRIVKLVASLGEEEALKRLGAAG